MYYQQLFWPSTLTGLAHVYHSSRTLLNKYCYPGNHPRAGDLRIFSSLTSPSNALGFDFQSLLVFLQASTRAGITRFVSLKSFKRLQITGMDCVLTGWALWSLAIIGTSTITCALCSAQICLCIANKKFHTLKWSGVYLYSWSESKWNGMRIEKLG